MKDLSEIFADLTLVMPTYQRQHFALERVKFWQQFHSVKMSILDGSPTKSPELEEACRGNFQYFHLPVSAQERLFFGIEQVKTKYAMIIADDDHLFPTVIANCILELEVNDKLVACIGNAISYRNQDGVIYFKHLYEHASHQSLLSASRQLRVAEHFNPYAPTTIYAVTRASEWKLAIKACSLAKFSCVYLSELLFELTISVQGQSKVVPQLMWLRCQDNGPVNTSGWNRKLSFLDWSRQKKYGNEVASFKSLVEEFFVNEMGLTPGEAAEVFDLFFEKYTLSVKHRKPTFASKVYLKLRRWVEPGYRNKWLSEQKLVEHFTRRGITVEPTEMAQFMRMIQ